MKGQNCVNCVYEEIFLSVLELFKLKEILDIDTSTFFGKIK